MKEEPTMDHGTVFLNAGKDKPVRQGHPWIFSGAIRKEPKNPVPGMIVDVMDADKKFVARGYYNPHSQIRVRVLTTNDFEMIDGAFIRRRIAQSVARREGLFLSGATTCARLVAHESDLLPGLIVDRYGDWISFQIVTAGMERWRPEIIEALKEICRPAGIIERSDDAVREKEGLSQRCEIVFGKAPEGPVPVLENGMKLFVDIEGGHKTGFYLDQRDNRAIIRDYAKGLRILNCFSFTGGFSVAAMMGGAKEVINVDESAPALDIARKNLEANGFKTRDEQFIRADVFKLLRDFKASGELFDLVILDPPKFVTSTAHIDRACRGYKDLSMIGMQLLKPNGLLATFSCSGMVSRDLFQKVVFGASHDAKVNMQIIKHLSQAECHPTLLTFPESLYLKGFLLRRIDS
jgi:23S rRNA (cytosine1962-C5)-methyltransferase